MIKGGLSLWFSRWCAVRSCISHQRQGSPWITMQACLIAIVLAGFAWVAGLGIVPQEAIATPIADATVSDTLSNSTSSSTEFPSDPVMTNVDQALVEIPSDYYGIRPASQLKQQIEDGSVFLIDVRQPSEYQSGHIDGAINIPLRHLARNLDRIPSEETIVLYCSTGYRTGMGVMALHLLGYDNVRGFPPSYQGWKQAQP